MEFGVIVFPGTWSDGDCFTAVTDNLGERARYVWHKDTDVSGIDCLIVPGGFSYGDYLRAGAIARFSPIMESVEAFASSGGLVIGICNGFQILCEAGILPGVLMRNDHLQFRCQWVNLRVETAATRFTNVSTEGDVLTVPISHGEGNYYADEAYLGLYGVQRSGGVQVLRPRRKRHSGRKSEWVASQHSGCDQRGGQRARHDAPS